MKVTSMLGEIEGPELAGLNLRGSCLTAFNWKGGKPGWESAKVGEISRVKIEASAWRACARLEPACAGCPAQTYRRPSFLGVPAQGDGCYNPPNRLSAFDTRGLLWRPQPPMILLSCSARGAKEIRALLDQLVPLVHAELQRLARGYMRGERQGHTLQTTALINEAFLRLIDWKNVSWQNRAHFFGVSAQLMRRILVDFARSRRNAKRGGDVSRVTLNEALIPAASGTDVVAVDDALKSLEVLDSRKAQIVELRFFGGLTTEETSEVMKLSTRTVEREWSLAQAWLLRELRKTKRG